VAHLKDEVRLLQAHYGRCEVAINYGGALNNAVSVLGEEILATCKAEPGLARQVLQKMSEAVMAVYDRLVCPLNGVPASASRELAFGIGNCPVGMIAPATYQSVVLPADLWLRSQFHGSFNLHHCGILTPMPKLTRACIPPRWTWGRALTCAWRARPMPRQASPPISM